MITDEEFKNLQDIVAKLQERLEKLDKTVSALSKNASASFMRNDTAETSSMRNDFINEKRDKTRYVFAGQTLCKRRLVLECVKQYVADNMGKSVDEIKEAFPDYIQGSLGIIKNVNDAGRYSGAHKRFFFADPDIIRVKDTNLVVCSQWDAKNIDRFIKFAKEELGYSINIIKRKY